MKKDITYYQFGVLVFILGFTFKVSRFPSIIFDDLKQSTVYFVALFILVDILISFLILKIAEKGLFIKQEGVFPSIIAVIFAISWILKFILFFDTTTQSISNQFPQGISNSVVFISLGAVVAYIALKGKQTVARTSEFFTPIILVILIIVLFFIGEKPNLSRNLPVFSDNAGILSLRFIKYLSWFGDFTPLIYFTVKKGKIIYPIIFSSILFVSITLCLVFSNSYYGNAIGYVENLIVKLSGMNAFVSQIGRLEWLGIIAWLISSFLYLSILLCSIGECLKVIKIKSFITIIIVSVLSIIYVYLFSGKKYIRDIAISFMGYYSIISNYILPIVIFIFYYIRSKDEKTFITK